MIVSWWAMRLRNGTSADIVVATFARSPLPCPMQVRHPESVVPLVEERSPEPEREAGDDAAARHPAPVAADAMDRLSHTLPRLRRRMAASSSQVSRGAAPASTGTNCASIACAGAPRHGARSRTALMRYKRSKRRAQPRDRDCPRLRPGTARIGRRSATGRSGPSWPIARHGDDLRGVCPR